MRPVVIWIGLLQVVITLISLFRAKVLAVLLSPSGVGVVSTIDQLMMTIVQIGGLGLPVAALKYMSQAHSEGETQFQTSAVVFWRAGAVLSIAAASITFGVTRVQPQWLGRDLATYRTLLEIATLSIPPLLLTIMTANVLASGQRPISALGFNVATTFGLTVAAIIGVALNGMTGLYIATAIFGLAGMIAGAVLLKQVYHVRWLTPDRSASPRLGTAVFATSAGIYAATAVYSVSLFTVRYVVFDRLGAAPAGLFQSAMSIALTVGAVLAPISNLYLAPILNRHAPAQLRAETADNFAERMILLLLLSALPIVLLPHVVLQILYTSAFFPAAEALLLLVIWQCIFQVAYVYQQLLLALDDTLGITVLCFVCFGGAAAMVTVLVPIIGLAGAPAALIIGTTAYGVALAMRLRFRHRIAISRAVVLRVGWVLLILFVAGLVTRDMKELTFSGIATRLGIALAAFGFTWMSFLRNSPEMAALSLAYAKFRNTRPVSPGSPAGQ